MNEVDNVNILKETREQNKLTQTEMANKLDISVQRYNSYERKI
ncbi:helix-turn-helix domain-containing protein [Tissierella carlieri]|uniref:Helix-turn-helix transcriptional regulator n=1 Tax=Tissierella carlieri TaxID=689904 RepID=A0ABT1SE27_9FIRM|nr:helix-turn-helix transcriptional regulator [Tissierella carlieri]MCQ4924725.1 helix-turn-helix transcriptional regulator [Tissierella carlieri]